MATDTTAAPEYGEFDHLGTVRLPASAWAVRGYALTFTINVRRRIEAMAIWEANERRAGR